MLSLPYFCLTFNCLRTFNFGARLEAWVVDAADPEEVAVVARGLPLARALILFARLPALTILLPWHSRHGYWRGTPVAHGDPGGGWCCGVGAPAGYRRNPPTSMRRSEMWVVLKHL